MKEVYDDTVDLREFVRLIIRNQKILWITLAIVIGLALAYVTLATKWWSAEATIEIGKYYDPKQNKSIYLEKGDVIAKRLQIKFIDSYKNNPGQKEKIVTVKTNKQNPQFITIVAHGESNRLATKALMDVINETKQLHRSKLEELLHSRKKELDNINKEIKEIEKFIIPDIRSRIESIRTIHLPAIEKRMDTLTKELQGAQKHKKEAQENLLKLYDNPALAALRLAQIQSLESKISSIKMKLVDLKVNREELIKTKLPKLQHEIEKLKNIDLHKLKNKKEILQLSLSKHSYQNTKIIGKTITQDKPVKPKTLLILTVSVIIGLILGVFIVLFYEFALSIKDDQKTSN